MILSYIHVNFTVQKYEIKMSLNINTMALFGKFVQRRQAEERASSLALLLLLISVSIFDLPCTLKEMFIFEHNRESVFTDDGNANVRCVPGVGKKHTLGGIQGGNLDG